MVASLAPVVASVVVVEVRSPREQRPICVLQATKATTSSLRLGLRMAQRSSTTCSLKCSCRISRRPLLATIALCPAQRFVQCGFTGNANDSSAMRTATAIATAREETLRAEDRRMIVAVHGPLVGASTSKIRRVVSTAEVRVLVWDNYC